MTVLEQRPHEETEERAPRRRRLLSVAVPLALAVVLLALLATSAWFWREGRRDDGRAAAVTAGRTAALRFFSLDKDDSSSIDKLLASSTGSFRKEYAAQRDRLVQEVRSKRLTVTAKVPENGTAVEFLSERRAQVLVAVDTTTTTPDAKGEASSYRTRVVLSRVGERWLVSGLEQVG